MILFLYGQDTQRSREQLGKIVERFHRERDPQGLNVVELSLPQDTLRVFEEIAATPFLAEKRMVVVRRPLAEGSSEFIKEFSEYIQDHRLPDSTVLVLWEETDTWKSKKTAALAEVLAKEKYAQRFDVLAGKNLSAWLVREIEARGAKIETAALSALIGAENPTTLAPILEQLVAYAQGRAITQNDVHLFLPPSLDDKIFDCIDAALAGNTKHAMRLLGDQYQLGKDSGYVFAMLLRQCRILLSLADFRAKGNADALMAKALALHPFVVKKSLSLLSRYSLIDLKNMYRELLDMDRAIKTGQDGAALIDVFFFRCYAHPVS